MTAPGAERAASGGAGITVVIVDDHFLVADGLAATLSAAGDISVLGVAGTCADGVAEVLRAQPDVLLLDQRLPDGLGIDALALLFAACPTMKVLLVTAEASDDVLFKALRGGCAGFVRKGSRAAELTAAVRAASRDEVVIGNPDLQRLMPRLRGSRRVGDDLTVRERTILNMLAEGAGTAIIADAMVIAIATARNHIQAVITKLGAHSRLQAVAIALREGIVDPK